MGEQLVACLESARVNYSRVRELGWRARWRIADARMDLAILYLKAGRLASGCRALARAIGEYPPQLIALAQVAWRSTIRRAVA